MTRKEGRRSDQIRPVDLQVGFVMYPEGSVLFSLGGTRVLCNVTIEQGVPAWMQSGNIQGGWVTAEYAMLPRSTHVRTPRETVAPRGRTAEIRRLVGRSLRAAVHLEQLPTVTCIVDCDVIQADGGTRTASVTGGYIALALALNRITTAESKQARIFASPVAAISVGKVDGEMLVDLDYDEDSRAEADLNLVMNANGDFIEIQGTAERCPFKPSDLEAAIELGWNAIDGLISIQREALAAHGLEGV
ncbi:MAG: ribonuclease PH [Anaerolineales bacterium]|jgi:ribonuclease PH